MYRADDSTVQTVPLLVVLLSLPSQASTRLCSGGAGVPREFEARTGIGSLLVETQEVTGGYRVEAVRSAGIWCSLM
jgi:hypothetical protein